MNLRNRVVTSVCAMSFGVTGFVSAQQVQNGAGQRVQQVPGQVQVQNQPKAGQAAQQTQWMNTDQTLASCIAIANQTEVTIAKLAEEKAKNDDVKKFAGMLVKDHQKFLSKLQKFAPEATREGYLNDRADSASDNQNKQSRVEPAGGQVKNAAGQVQQTSGAQATGSEAGQPLDFVQLHKEVAEQCIQSAKRGMNKKDGAEFDECFVGFQIAAHAQMKDKLIVFQRHASGELGQVIAEGLETTERHLKKAENLIKDLRDSGSDRKSARSDK